MKIVAVAVHNRCFCSKVQTCQKMNLGKLLTCVISVNRYPTDVCPGEEKKKAEGMTGYLGCCVCHSDYADMS